MITIWERIGEQRKGIVDNAELMFLIKHSGKHLIVSSQRERDYLKSLELILGCEVRVFGPKEYGLAERPMAVLSVEGLPTD